MNELDKALLAFKRDYYLDEVSKTFIEKSQQERSDALINGIPSAVKKGRFSKEDSEIMTHILREFDNYRDIRNLVAHGSLVVSDLPVKADGNSPLVLYYMNSEDTKKTLEHKAKGGKETARLEPMSVAELSGHANKLDHLVDQLFEILAVRTLHPDLSELVLTHVKAFKAGESRLFLDVKKEKERRQWEREQTSASKDSADLSTEVEAPRGRNV